MLQSIKVSMETAIRAMDHKLAQSEQIRKDKVGSCKSSMLRVCRRCSVSTGNITEAVVHSGVYGEAGKTLADQAYCIG